MPGADKDNIDHVQRKLNKILETRYDTDKVSTLESLKIVKTSSIKFCHVAIICRYY